MKRVKKTLAMFAAIACALTGCGNSADRDTNIKNGMEMIEKSDYDGAMSAFEAARVYNEDDQLLYRGEGIAYMGLGDYEKAVSSFLTSLSYARGKVTGLEFDTNYYLAASYFKLGDYKEAENTYSAIINMDNKQINAYFLRACALLKQNQYEASAKDFEKTFALAPDNLDMVKDAYLEMQAAGYESDGKVFVQKFMDSKGKVLSDIDKGVLYYYLEDYDNARIYLDGALNKGDAEASLLLGKTYEKLGDMNYAGVVYKSYLDGYQPVAEIYNGLGTCYMAQKKYGDALSAYEAGIEMGDSACIRELRFNQIVAKEFLGFFGEAKQLMEQYLVDYPEDVNAKREYEFLKTR